MFKIWNSELIPPEYHLDHSHDSPPPFPLSNLGFPKKETIAYGVKTKIEFFDKFDDDGNYYDPLLQIIIETFFDKGIPKRQTLTRSWMLENGNWGNPQLSSQPIRKPKVFLQKMRTRVIEELIDLADRFGLADKLKALYEEYSTYIYIYKEGGSPKFREAIRNSKESWLKAPSTDGRTVRDVIIDYLSIAVVEDN